MSLNNDEIDDPKYEAGIEEVRSRRRRTLTEERKQLYIQMKTKW